MMSDETTPRSNVRRMMGISISKRVIEQQRRERQ
jgi:hypothetical protein